MARKRRCPRPINRLVMLRTKGLEGPRFQNTGSGCVKGQGNFFGIGGPGSGVSAISGVVIDANTTQITFTPCVHVNTTTGVQVNIADSGWSSVSGFSDLSTTVVRFTHAFPVDPGDSVRWRYLGGTDSLVDCDEGEDIGPQEIAVNNPLVLAGDFVLMETGGVDIALVEEDPDGTEGVEVEEKP